MFLEDEREVTGIQEDVYFKKKPSLLLLDPKSQEQGEQSFNERSEIVDDTPQFLVDLVQKQVSLFPSDENTLVRFSRNTRANQIILYLYNKTRQSYIYIYMFPIAGQTAGPIGLKFFVDTHGWPGVI